MGKQSISRERENSLSEGKFPQFSLGGKNLPQRMCRVKDLLDLTNEFQAQFLEVFCEERTGNAAKRRLLMNP